MGFVNNNGARHAESMSNSIKRSGWLDEKRLIIESYGFLQHRCPSRPHPRQPLRSLKARKLPPLFHHKRPGAAKVKRIFEKLESK